MATTVKQSFREYASNLELTDRQQQKVSNCRENVTKALAKELTLHSERSKVIGSMDGNFKPLIKMVKGWNRDEGWPIKSFHLEAMMYHRYHSYTQSYTYASMLALFFEDLPTYLAYACYDPVTNDRLDNYLNVGTKRQQVIAKAQQAAQLSAQALAFENTNEEQAIKIWKVLLGSDADHTKTLKDLSSQKTKLNKSSLPIPRIAYVLARKGVNEGEADYSEQV